jgi:hypothetical protein
MTKMKNGKSTLIAIGILMSSGTAVHANDYDRNLGIYPSSAPSAQTGVAARVQLVIPLSPASTSSREEPWHLKLSAGPQLNWNSARDGTQQRFSSFLQFSLRPQHSSRLSIAGHDVFANWDDSVLAAERNAADNDSGISTAGWFGIALGSAAVVGGVLLLSDSDSCEPCGPGELPCIPQPC